ncbi:MAG: hypothetical protein JO007_15945 [Alphaproteobacteria bacterium]|nr:hypothetical protein [Alphaproteobacteria bacterium]
MIPQPEAGTRPAGTKKLPAINVNRSSALVRYAARKAWIAAPTSVSFQNQSVSHAYCAAEERLDLAEAGGGFGAELGVMRCRFGGGIDQQAAAPIAVDRPLDDLAEKRPNRLLRKISLS